MFDKKEIAKLYNEDGLSMGEISKKLGVSIWQIVSFMRKNNIVRRKQYETRKIQFDRSPISFTTYDKLNEKYNKLWQLGNMLYWAEGSKANKFAVDFANSNSVMVKIFLEMLRKVYRVREERISVYLYCYANQNPQSLIDYWSSLLKIPVSRFSKPYIRKDFRIEKINKMPFGMVHVRYYDSRLLKQIIKDIDIISKDVLG